MPRLKTVKPEEAPAAVKAIYDDLIAKSGKVVNIFQGMGNSAAGLQAYLSMAGTLAQGTLAPEDREAVYLAVSQQNGCHYCVSAHTFIAKNKVGLSDEEIMAVRTFQSPDAKRQALLAFVKRVIETKGFVEDSEVEAVRQAGYDDGQIVEAVAYIGLATYSNLFNAVYDTPLDFPPAPKLDA